MKILVVDDEPMMAVLIRQKFRRRIKSGELHFISAKDGVDALTTLAEHPDTVIALCDINMPRMNGIELLEELQTEHPLVKPVVISAYGDHGNIRAAMQRGAFDFLTKPIDLAGPGGHRQPHAAPRQEDARDDPLDPAQQHPADVRQRRGCSATSAARRRPTTCRALRWSTRPSRSSTSVGSRP